MKGWASKLFHIYSGEERNAFMFACLGFLWALAVTSGQKFADALFLLHVGADSLPTAYMLTACVMIILAAFLLKAFHVFSIHRIFIAVLGCGICFYGIALICLVLKIGIISGWLWFALKIFGSLLFCIVVTCFWTFIDQYYHMQDAKRLFSLFTSAIFLGVATTGAIMRSGLIAFEQLTLIIICLLSLTIYWILRIVNKIKPVYDEAALENSGSESENTFRFLIRAILNSRFTLLLMTGNFLVYLFLVVTEFSYLSAFEQYFSPETTILPGGEQNARLTQFLGQCVAGVSILNLIFGLFFYSRLVRRFGVNNMVLLTPSFLLITFSGWLLNGGLIFPIMGFFVVEGMLIVIDDNNFTLLLNAVPHKMKYKIRLIIESFFEPVGMLVSSLLIAYAPIDSRVLGLILSVCALSVALILRRQYLKAIYLNLADNAVHFQRSIRGWVVGLPTKQRKTTERRLLALVHMGDETSQLLAIETLLSFTDKKDLTKLLLFSEDLSITAKMTFISLLVKSHFVDNPQILEKLHHWQQTESNLQLQGAISFYLARLGFMNAEEIKKNLGSELLELKGAAILALKKSNNLQDHLLAKHYLEQFISSDNETDICMGLKIFECEGSPQDVDLLLPFLNSDSIKIKRSAASALAQSLDKTSTHYASHLLMQLEKTSDTELRQSYLRGLGKISDPQFIKPIISNSNHFRPLERRLAEIILSNIGLEIVPSLLDILKDKTMPDRCRILAGRVFGRLALTQLRENLYEIVNIEIERAYFYFYHLHIMQAQYPHLDLVLLEDDLRSSFHSVLDFIIQLLSVAGESEDCELLSRCLRSPNPKIRSQVVETLEKTCEPQIFRALYPLIADLPQEEKMRQYLKGGRVALDLPGLLDEMSRSSIQGDKLVAIALQYRLNMPNWKETLKQQLNSREEIFHHFAYELLDT